MAFILIETADRETGVLKFRTMEEAQKAMFDAFEEVLGYNATNIQDDMKCIYEEIERMGYYEDSECGINEYTGWINRPNGGHLDWLIEEINTNDIVQEAIQHYHDILRSVMNMKAIEARDLADKEDDMDSYNSAWLEGQYAGLKEATRTIDASTFLFKKEDK